MYVVHVSMHYNACMHVHVCRLHVCMYIACIMYTCTVYACILHVHCSCTRGGVTKNEVVRYFDYIVHQVGLRLWGHATQKGFGFRD